MSTQPDILIKGADGANNTATPTPGKDADPLGPDGNGQPGIYDKISGCTQRAGNGVPGNNAGNAPPAQGGGNGIDSYTFDLRCVRFSGQQLSILSQGGNGGKGGSGGKGGTGGTGGNAGLQPQGCAKQYGDSIGGTGGRGGIGGHAGDGGNAGWGGDITIVYDENLSNPIERAASQPGQPGDPGSAGDPGDPGAGGLNGDGKTQAPSGGRSSPGGTGQFGTSGKGGKITVSTAKQPQYQLTITVVTQAHGG